MATIKTNSIGEIASVTPVCLMTPSHSTVRTAANLMREVYRNITKAIQFGNFRFVLGTCLFCCSLKALPAVWSKYPSGAFQPLTRNTEPLIDGTSGPFRLLSGRGNAPVGCRHGFRSANWGRGHRRRLPLLAPLWPVTA